MSEMPARLKHATVWMLIGLALFLGISWWQRQAAASRIRIDGQTIELRRADDGHYHWPGRLNGVAVDFLVDTGATSTAVPQALADRAGLRTRGRVSSDTAGGIVDGRLSTGDVDLDGGVRATALRIAVLPALGKPLLGMDVLSKMRITLHDDVMRLDPPDRGRP